MATYDVDRSRGLGRSRVQCDAVDVLTAETGLSLHLQVSLAALVHRITGLACAPLRYSAMSLPRKTCCCYIAVTCGLAHPTLRFVALVDGRHNARDRLCASVGAVRSLTVTIAALTRLWPCLAQILRYFPAIVQPRATCRVA